MPVNQSEAYYSTRIMHVFMDPNVHQTVKNLLSMCECFAAKYLQVSLVANLWKFTETKLHVYYQVDRPITGEQYYLNAVYTNFHSLSNKIYADVKQLCKHLNIMDTPKCEKCKIRHEQRLCPLYTLFFTLNAQSALPEHGYPRNLMSFPACREQPAW